MAGTIIEEFGKTNIVISGFVEAKFCEATPTTLKFTHETWEYVHKEIEKKHNGKKIVGWIHTHPDFGIFLSEYDKFIHQNFFNESYQMAYVIDPIQNIEGFYFWINENIEKCKGFYIYDKTGVEITTGQEKEVSEDGSEPSLFGIKNILIAVLSVAVVFLILSNISTNNRLEEIERQQTTLTDSANQSLTYMQQLIWSQSAEIQKLNNILKEAGIIVEPTTPTDTENEGAIIETDSKSENTTYSTDDASTTDEPETSAGVSETATTDSTEGEITE